jgi:hypothetical protein
LGRQPSPKFCDEPKKNAEYEAVTTRPREDRVASSTATAWLPQWFGELSELLTELMDGLMFQFRETAPTFYHEYFKARKLVGPATRSTAPAPAASEPRSVSIAVHSSAGDANLALAKAA